MFVNFSNHPSANWSREQLTAASRYGEIIDIPFPNIDPFAGEEEVAAIANKYHGEIMEFAPRAVLCQGEFSLSFALTKRLKNIGITVLVACSERCVEEITDNGATVKTAKYKFVRFREL